MTSAFDVRSLSVAFGTRVVLREVTVTIPPRRVTAILGPSGSGKSTFLRVLNRTLELTEGARVVAGQVRFGDVDLHDPRHDPSVLRRRIGMIHQRPTPFPMSILENVLFGAGYHGLVPRGGRQEFARRHLERVGLWDEVSDRLGAPAHALSGGQQQRLCLARTLAVDPEVVLMDEPCSSLDPHSTRRIEALALELAREVTIVIVTHDVAQARRVADHVIFLTDGALVESGVAVDLFERPRTESARDFVRGVAG